MLLTRSQVRTQNISVISTQKWEGLGARGHGCSVVVYRTPTEFDRNPTNVSSSLHPQPFMHLHPLFIYFLLPTTQGFNATNMCFFMYSILDFFFYIHQGFQVFLSGFTFVYLWDSLSLITRIILHILMTDSVYYCNHISLFLFLPDFLTPLWTFGHFPVCFSGFGSHNIFSLYSDTLIMHIKSYYTMQAYKNGMFQHAKNTYMCMLYVLAQSN